jgi:DNA-binding response OmpR family regulator
VIKALFSYKWLAIFSNERYNQNERNLFWENKSMEKSILLVDNDVYTTQKIEEYLKIYGFQLTSTKNAQFGISTLRSQKPDLILISDGVDDMDMQAFLERKKKIMGAENIPVFVFVGKAKIADVKMLLRQGAVETLTRPVVLERLRKAVFHHLGITENPQEKHLITEVFIREGIIVIEIGGSLAHADITALKFRVLDTARTDQTIKKRFYIILYGIEEENPSQSAFDKLFDFVTYFPRLPDSNVKILTSDQNMIQLIKNSSRASHFEIVDNYIGGLNKLKSLYLVNEENEVLVEFLKPGIVLYKNLYDKKGTLVKEQGKSFSTEELRKLSERDVKKLYYTRKAKIGSDRQILENEDVDVVMDSIELTGVVVPEELKDLSTVRETKKQFAINILIVNNNEDDLMTLRDFFLERGFSVSTSLDSKGALALIKNSLYDYVLIDLGLDNGNGLNFIKSMKLLPRARDAQFILTGRMVRNESVEQAIQLGVKGFLTSPFDLNRLSQIIK